MAYPTTIVEIAFNDGPYVAFPTWTAVTSFVRQINIQRGRNDELSNFESGNTTVVLDNRARTFDPFYTAGTYYGKLLPRRQIRIQATVSVTTYPVFRGFVEGWPVSITDAGYDSTVTLQCFDALGLLADEELPDDLADVYIRSLTPRHYYPLTDPINPLAFTTQTLQDFGSNPIPLRSTNAALRISNAPGLALGLADTSFNCSDTQVVTPSFFMQTGAIAATATSLVAWTRQIDSNDNTVLIDFGLSCFCEAGYEPTTSTFYVLTNTTTTLRTYEGSLFSDISNNHHIAICVNADGTLNSVYYDGLAVSLTLISSVASAQTVYEEVDLLMGRKQQVAVFNRILTSTEITTIFQLAAGRAEEGTVARFNRLIGYTSFPAALTSTPSSTYSGTVLEISAGGPPVTDELQTLSDSEGGNLFVLRSGYLVLTSKTGIFEGTSLASMATFGGAGNISIGQEAAYRLDAKNIRNTLAIGYSGDGTIEVSDSASVTAYGIASGSWSTQLSTVDQAQQLGNLLVGFSSTPAVVIDPIEVNVSASDAGWGDVLTLELLNRYTLNIVQQTGSTLSLQQILQSVEHVITPAQWSTTINGSVRFTNPFILDSSLLDGTDLLT